MSQTTSLGAVPLSFYPIITYFALKMNENWVSNMKTGPLWVEYVCFLNISWDGKYVNKTKGKIGTLEPATQV